MLAEHAARAASAELMRRHNVSRQTLHSWKNRYGDRQVSDANALKALEDEHAHLKRLVPAQSHIERLLRDFNTGRPHEACQPLTLHEYARTFITPFAQLSA